MPAYRLYRLDGAGKFYGGDWFAADSDEQAVAYATEKKLAMNCEVWERDRFVARVHAYERPSGGWAAPLVS